MKSLEFAFEINWPLPQSEMHESAHYVANLALKSRILSYRLLISVGNFGVLKSTKSEPNLLKYFCLASKIGQIKKIMANHHDI